MLITERTDTVVGERELRRVREVLLRVPENIEHVEVLLRAARLLEPEMDYDQMKLEYNRIPACKRDEWVKNVEESLNAYEVTLEAERNG